MLSSEGYAQGFSQSRLGQFDIRRVSRSSYSPADILHSGRPQEEDVGCSVLCNTSERKNKEILESDSKSICGVITEAVPS